MVFRFLLLHLRKKVAHLCSLKKLTLTLASRYHGDGIQRALQDQYGRIWQYCWSAVTVFIELIELRRDNHVTPKN